MGVVILYAFDFVNALLTYGIPATSINFNL